MTNRITRAVVLGVVFAFLIAGAQLVLGHLRAAELAARSDGMMVTLDWAPVPDAVTYEVQCRILDGEWLTLGVTSGSPTRIPVMADAVRFRVRAWRADGPGRWSRPSEFLFSVPENRPEVSFTTPGIFIPRTLAESCGS